MPEKETIERAQEDAREGKSPSSQAGEFVREEIHHCARGKTRCALRETGDRDRTLESAPSRCEATAPGQRQGLGKGQGTGQQRLSKGAATRGASPPANGLELPLEH
jgi:hypothetical protein